MPCNLLMDQNPGEIFSYKICKVSVQSSSKKNFSFLLNNYSILGKVSMKQSNRIIYIVAIFCLLLYAAPEYSPAKPSASVKFSTIREENPKIGQETLILPYGFPSDSLGTTFGVGGMTKGYFQDQLLLAGTLFGSTESAFGGVLGMWDLALFPATDRLYLSAMASMGRYPNQRAYADPPGFRPEVKAGANDSDKDDYIEDGGTDNWWEMKLEYVLPIGGMRGSGMATYKLKNGMLVSGSVGGDSWNPLTGGATVLVLRQFNRYQDYETNRGDIEGTIHPVELGVLYNNTDFYANPSTGSSQYLSVTRDFGWLDSEETWTFLQFEASKYFSLGSSDYARQRVVALNFWTGDAVSEEISVDAAGNETVSHSPPFLEGAKLGGFYRMRAYPNNRFNDKSVIYTTAEYRYTPEWNPIGEINWLRWLKMDWMQLVGFVEGGRVADDYDLSDLLSDWKGDIGFGFRAMMAGGVVRFDFAVSDEESAGWVMFGQPF